LATDEVRDAVASFNLPGKLILILGRHKAHPRVVKHGLWALVNVLSTSETNKRLVPIGGLSVLLEFVKNGRNDDPHAAESEHAACIALLELCRLGTPFRKHLVSTE